VRAKKSLGQNFLVDKNLQKKIVAALGASADDEVVEIGPGRGALTAHLVGHVRRLVLVELDDELVKDLNAAYALRPDVEVVHADVLTTPLDRLTGDPAHARIVGNIPYNITTPIVFHLLARPRPGVILLMVQKEVAERIVAAPGTSEYGALSVGVRSVATVERVLNVPRGAFRPVPGVDSAVVRITPMTPAPLSESEEVRLRTLTRATFQWRRKQLKKTLRDHPDLSVAEAFLPEVEREMGISLTSRPEELSPEDFVRLSRVVAAQSRFA
jgi:16S rRNA (adenine1518-N6/adenine1519-N6)-dimethyltransferase